MFVARYSGTTGDCINVYTFGVNDGGVVDGAGDVVSVALDGAGSIYVGGDFYDKIDLGIGGLRTTAGLTDIFVAKYASDGTPQWAKTFGGEDHDSLGDLIIDKSGNIIITGYAGKTAYFGAAVALTPPWASFDVFVGKYEPDMGDRLWTQWYSGAAGEKGQALAVDSSNNILVGGRNTGNVSFGGN